MSVEMWIANLDLVVPRFCPIRKADQDGKRSFNKKKKITLHYFDKSKSYVTFYANQTGGNM